MNNVEIISPFVRDAKYKVTAYDGVLEENVNYDFKILYLKQGTLEMIIQGKKYIGEPGDIFFLRPKMQYAIRSLDSIEIHLLYVQFDLFPSHDRRFASPILQNIGDREMADKSLFREDVFRDDLFIPDHVRLLDPATFEHKMTSIINEFEQKMTLYELEVKAKLTRLLVYLWRELTWNQEKVDPNYKTLLKVKNYLNENFMSKVTLDDLVTITNISKFYLIQLFKKKFGVTPIQYHQTVRIEKSKQLIRHTNYSLSEIADKLGFESIHSFSRYFKKAVGYSPSCYRKKR